MTAGMLLTIMHSIMVLHDLICSDLIVMSNIIIHLAAAHVLEEQFPARPHWITIGRLQIIFAQFILTPYYCYFGKGDWHLWTCNRVFDPRLLHNGSVKVALGLRGGTSESQCDAQVLIENPTFQQIFPDHCSSLLLFSSLGSNHTEYSLPTMA